MNVCCGQNVKVFKEIEDVKVEGVGDFHVLGNSDDNEFRLPAFN